MSRSKTLNLTQAGIADLREALNSGSLTSVELVARYMHRIGQFDMRGPCLNSVVVLNPNLFAEAQASDDYRASGHPLRPLEGIPFTVKDSFKVKGMTVAAGSPAFADLIASDDAAIIEHLRDAGAIVLGKTNMPPMADGGCQRGLYGRAESPYSTVYSTTAYASGSSTGCGTSTTSAFAAFGIAGETVTSGRAPASNNALVGYSPSRGVIPNRGQWPLYPTCDVIVPHTRTVADLLDVLNIIVADDAKATQGIDFWRNQTFIPIPLASEVRPVDFHSLENQSALRGKRIAVPKCFLGIEGSKPPTYCSQAVRELFDQARQDLEALGATLVETDFPLFEQYTSKDFPGQGTNVPGLSVEWANIERCNLIAMAWDDFLRTNSDQKYPNLASADPLKIHPHIAPLDDPSAHSEAQNQVRYGEMIDLVRDRDSSIYMLPGCEPSIKALENMRKSLFEDWMDKHGYDLLAFPTNGDVSFADADENIESMRHALQDGVKYANGGRALKHLGVPCITVPMGEMKDKQMPVGITFVTKGWTDQDLLKYAFAYEAGSQRRTAPHLAPEIATDHIPLTERTLTSQKPVLKIKSAVWEKEHDIKNEIRHVSVRGTLTVTHRSISIDSIEAFVDGSLPTALSLEGETWSFSDCLCRPKRNDKYPTLAPVPKDHFLLVIVAKASNGRCDAQMLMIE